MFFIICMTFNFTFIRGNIHEAFIIVEMQHINVLYITKIEGKAQGLDVNTKVIYANGKTRANL